MQRFLPVYLFIALSFFACGGPTDQPVAETPAESTSPARPKNIIFMVGDGMGLTQITAGMYANDNKLFLEKFKHIGLSKTHSGDTLITDSAAGATAFACGVKTYNGAIGVGMDTLPVETIMETAKKQGFRTGLVVTYPVTHATPAAFFAHQKSRKLDEAIALHILDGTVDWFIGAGKPYFEQRKDGRNLSEELRKLGYYMGYSLDEIKPGMEKVGLLVADTIVPSITDGRGDFLGKGTELAIQSLSKSPKGFFLLVEGSQIDRGGHDNDSQYIINEMIDFDKVIGQVLEFAEKDGNTLVIVTADHETGGYAINGGNVKNKTFDTGFTTGYHTATMVPVFAYGPGAEEFMGIYENTAIFDKMMALLGFK